MILIITSIRKLLVVLLTVSPYLALVYYTTEMTNFKIDIEYIEELLASHNEELSTEELSNFKFVDHWKKRSK